jgi:microfibrillar-associated protein 1
VESGETRGAGKQAKEDGGELRAPLPSAGPDRGRRKEDRPGAPEPAAAKRFQARASSSSSESSSESSEGSSSSSSEEDTDEEEEEGTAAAPAIAFVPKHRRNLVRDPDAIERQRLADEDRRRAEAEDRRHESRALVQRIVLEKARAPAGGGDDEDGGALEGITGARNAVPSDDDGDGDNDAASLRRDRERLDWEVREVLRLLRDEEAEAEREREAADRLRRRGMTDEELARERQQQELLQRGRGEDSRAHQDEGRQKQRYYHKGAFFLDDSEWSEGDVRHRASEYAQAPTGSDLVDRRRLPKVMQSRGFGRANQSKYRGLVEEDTTDRRAEVLPLAHPSKGKPKR